MAPSQESGSELSLLLERKALSFDQASALMRRILQGQEPAARTAALLTALRMKGETAEEMAGFAAAMRESMLPVPAPAGATVVDTCGTGGDGTGTFNISTVVAFVVAGAGVVVAKHGNRSITSRSGSADVLEALGVRIGLEPEQMRQCLEQCGIGFLFAPALHPAMKHVQPVRKELGFRTVFNLLGPLANPAAAPHQVIGVPSPEVARKMAHALHRLGTRRSLVVHGTDGLDELTLSAPSIVYDVSEKRVVHRRVEPGDFGLSPAPLAALAGGEAAENAEIAGRILRGQEQGPPRDVVVLNAAAVLVACGVARDWRGGAQLAAQAIDNRAALRKLESLAALTQALTAAKQ